MSIKRLLILLICFFPLVALAGDNDTARVSVLASGKLLLNGKTANLYEIDDAFRALKAEHGTVWYYRANPQAEPPPVAMDVLNLAIKYRLPITLSSKPDFSDYIGKDGRSHPRRSR